MNNKDKLIFNENNLLRYLIEYDYIQEKYGIDKNSDKYTQCAEYESQNLSADVVKRDYSSIYENIRLVYGDGEKANRMMMIYKIIKEEVVNKFLNIPGLERIYDEHFFEFEWDMHSRLDFDNHNISFYRDHFIHQVRNLYEMNEFFSNEKFYLQFRDEFCYGSSKIAAYVNNGIRRILSGSCKGSIKPDIWDDEKRLRNAYIDYIIKASTALCTLFHDIGYPIIHFNKLRTRISGFMPSMYMFFGSDGNNFENIYALLCNSLLFRIVSKEELRRAVCGNDNHGAVSAVAFLLTFYETGVIGAMSEDKKIAIEIAAVAIYNHTIKYELVDNDTRQGYYSPIYKLNPLAYLLRLCDDIQEWERTYFEIQDIPDLIFCEDCGRPWFRKEYSKGYKTKRFKYKCECQAICSRRNNDYVRRKIIDIINCREVRVSFSEQASEKPVIWVDLDYDPALLLKMCHFVPSYSQYRVKDLNKFKTLLTNQRFGSYTATGVRYMLTPNPLILKANIIGNMMGLYDRAGSSFINGLIGSENDDVVRHRGHAHNTSYIRAAEFLIQYNDELSRRIADSDKVETIKSDNLLLRGFAEPVKAIIMQYRSHISEAVREIENCISELSTQKDRIDKNVRKIKEETEQAKKDLYIKECKELTDSMRDEVSNVRDGLETAAMDLFKRCTVEFKKVSLKRAIKNFYNYKDNNLVDMRVQSFKFYLRLYILSEFFAEMNKSCYKVWKKQCIIKDKSKGGWTSACDIVSQSIKQLLIKDVESNNKVLELKIFINDAIDQYAKMFPDDDTNAERLCTDDYYEQFVSKDKVYIATKKYSDKNNPINNTAQEKLDYYSDLDLYIRLSEYTRQIYSIVEHYDTTRVFIE